MQETWLPSVGQEELLEKAMATHSSILAWEAPMGRGARKGTVSGESQRWTWLSMSERILKEDTIPNYFKRVLINLFQM